MYSMDPVVVIGGCGSLCHHIVKQLLEVGASIVTVFDVNIENHVIPNAKYVKGSIKSPYDVLQIFESVKPLIVFHTASPSMMSQRNTRQIFQDVNIKGTQVLLEYIVKVGITKAFVYTSSPH